MQGTTQKWRNAVEQGTVWIDDGIQFGKETEQSATQQARAAVNPDGSGAIIPYTPRVAVGPGADLQLLSWEDAKTDQSRSKADIHAPIQLKDVLCPMCGQSHKVGGSRLRTRTGFPHFKCKNPACGEVMQSSSWHCRCRTRGCRTDPDGLERPLAR